MKFTNILLAGFLFIVAGAYGQDVHYNYDRGTNFVSYKTYQIDEAAPAPVLTSALYERFSSRGEADFANKLLSAMRYQFGGHLEKAGQKPKVA